MSIAFWAGLYGLLLGYGMGVRLTIWQSRREAKRVAAEFAEQVAALDAALTAAEAKAK